MRRFSQPLSLAPVAFGLAILALASCSPKSPDITGQISDLNMDPATGWLTGVRLKVQNNGDSAVPVDFAVRTGNVSSFWDARGFTGNLDPHSNRELVLAPESGGIVPQIGDVVAVYAIRRDSGAETSLGAKVLEGRTSRLLNADFQQWRQDGSLPRAWGGAAADKTDSLSYNPLSVAGQRGVDVGVSSSLPGAWHVAFLQQSLSIDKLHLHALVYPRQDCDAGNPSPHSLSGLQFADDIGDTIVFCVSPRLTSPQIQQLNDGHQLIVGLPGHLNQWNTLDADPAKYRATIRLHGDKLGLVELRAYVAINPVGDERHPKVVRASAVFGKITQER